LRAHFYTLRKKGTKAVTGAVPFQKQNFFILGANVYILGAIMNILGAIMNILGAIMYILGAIL